MFRRFALDRYLWPRAYYTVNSMDHTQYSSIASMLMWGAKKVKLQGTNFRKKVIYSSSWMHISSQLLCVLSNFHSYLIRSVYFITELWLESERALLETMEWVSSVSNSFPSNLALFRMHSFALAFVTFSWELRRVSGHKNQAGMNVG